MDYLDILSSHELVHTFVLKRGMLLQNIRVVDDIDQPVPRRCLIAELTSEDGASIQVEGTTDDNGLCDMTLPPFRAAILYVDERPDTVKSIHYETIHEAHGITLKIPSEITPDFLIRCQLQDSSGNQLKGILVYPCVMTKTEKWLKVMRSSQSDGSFSFPAFKGKVYNLSIHPERIGDRWYTSDYIQ